MRLPLAGSHMAHEVGEGDAAAVKGRLAEKATPGGCRGRGGSCGGAEVLSGAGWTVLTRELGQKRKQET